MLPILASLLFLICLSAGIYFYGYAARKAAALYVVALEIICGCIVIIPIIFFLDGLNFSELFTKPQKENWLWLGAASLFGFIGGNFFSLINLRTAGERTNSLLSPAITATAVLASTVVFNEIITAIKIIGIIITLSSVAFFLFSKTKNGGTNTKPVTALWSGAATVVCITLAIICSIKGTMHTQLSIMHSVWLRLIVALPLILTALLFTGNYKFRFSKLPASFYGAIAGGVITQTIIANYLFFYCSYKIGIATFQVIIATLPFFVYAADVYLLKRTKPSLYFLLTALLAALGIGLVML